MKFNAEIIKVPELDIFIANLNANGKEILVLTTEKITGHVAIYRGDEIYRTLDPTPHFFAALYSLLEDIRFEEPFTRAFAENVLFWSERLDSSFSFSMTASELDEQFKNELESFRKYFDSFLPPGHQREE